MASTRATWCSTVRADRCSRAATSALVAAPRDHLQDVVLPAGDAVRGRPAGHDAVATAAPYCHAAAAEQLAGGARQALRVVGLERREVGTQARDGSPQPSASAASWTRSRSTRAHHGTAASTRSASACTAPPHRRPGRPGRAGPPPRAALRRRSTRGARRGPPRTAPQPRRGPGRGPTRTTYQSPHTQTPGRRPGCGPAPWSPRRAAPRRPPGRGRAAEPTASARQRQPLAVVGSDGASDLAERGSRGRLVPSNASANATQQRRGVVHASAADPLRRAPRSRGPGGRQGRAADLRSTSASTMPIPATVPGMPTGLGEVPGLDKPGGVHSVVQLDRAQRPAAPAPGAASSRAPRRPRRAGRTTRPPRRGRAPGRSARRPRAPCTARPGRRPVRPGRRQLPPPPPPAWRPPQVAGAEERVGPHRVGPAGRRAPQPGPASTARRPSRRPRTRQQPSVSPREACAGPARVSSTASPAARASATRPCRVSTRTRSRPRLPRRPRSPARRTSASAVARSPAVGVRRGPARAAPGPRGPPGRRRPTAARPAMPPRSAGPVVQLLGQPGRQRSPLRRQQGREHGVPRQRVPPGRAGARPR